MIREKLDQASRGKFLNLCGFIRAQGLETSENRRARGSRRRQLGKIDPQSPRHEHPTSLSRSYGHACLKILS